MKLEIIIAVGAILFPPGIAVAAGGSMVQDVDGFYMVEDCLDLQAVGTASFGAASMYKLVADIDCFDTSNWNGGAGFEPIDGFHGVLDGQGHVVRSLYINRPSDLSVGLIGNMGGGTCDFLGGEIRSIGLADVDITGRWTVGALVGHLCPGAIIRSCFATGSVAGNQFHIGGLVGYSFVATVEDSYFSGHVIQTGGERAGGLVAANQGGTILRSYASGTVSGNQSVGGLVGFNFDFGLIQDSFVGGTVTGNSGVGGMVGRSFDGATIVNSYYNQPPSGPPCAGPGSDYTCTVILDNEAHFYDSSNPPMDPTWDFQNIWLENPGGFPTLRVFGASNAPPVALCQDLTLPASEDCTAQTDIDAGSYDPDGDGITLTQEPPGPYALGVTDVELTVSDGSLEDTCRGAVTVVDEAAPEALCNAPRTITPRHPPLTFTATAADNCGIRRLFLRAPSCFKINKARKSVPVPCRVSINGDSITIRNSGGVGTRVRWLATAVDTSWIPITRRCGVTVVRPSREQR